MGARSRGLAGKNITPLGERHHAEIRIATIENA